MLTLMAFVLTIPDWLRIDLASGGGSAIFSYRILCKLYRPAEAPRADVAAGS